MTRWTIILFLATMIVLASCEGISGGSGFVLSKNDNSAIDSAQVVLLLDDKAVDTIYSDEDGKFRIGRLVGCVPKCPESRLVISKEGFEPVDFNVNKEYRRNPNFTRDSVRIFLTPSRN